MGRSLMILGALIFAAGLAVHLAGRLPVQLGRLPGDIVIRGRHGTFYFPVVTCLVLSVVFSVVMWILHRR